ncbi:MAG: type III secretion system chaperone [Desulfovibrionaceae bacterium]|nr:type III secretion system chaperone [Desulfovibrionaceae bacterium]
MNIKDIAENIAKAFNVKDLESKDGLLEVEIDGAYVRIEETDGEAFVVTGRIGEVPSQGNETFAAIAHEGSYALMLTRAASVVRESRTGPYLLVERIPRANASDFASFCEAFTTFVDTLNVWRRQLAGFSPACAMAEEAAAAQKAEAEHALRGGFLRA